MWVESLRPHVGGVSLWRHALNFLVVVLAAFLTTIIFSATTHAAAAEWDSGSLVYNDQKYEGPSTATKAFEEKTGIPEGSEYYELIDASEDPKKSQILYFTPGTDKADATSAQYAEFDYDNSTTDVKYSIRGSPSTVEVNQESYEAGGTKEETSCTVSGIGYIICPIMNLLAEAMDKMFEILKSLLHVKPLSTDTEGGLYKAWSFMLAIANVCFVIGFIVIIYSYVTNQGVNQFDLRSIIPRIIIAAVLINASYYICAIAVDASNIFGANLQDMFNDLRSQLGSSNETVTDTNTWRWAAITTYILSAGTIGAGIVGLGTFGAAALHLLMPVLVAAIIAILVVLVVLAVRQALITVLIILAPIAFAAFILPSTQKYFDKWKSLFVTMLIMYPMFSVLFGGSQLAAHLIAQNATNVITILFAMFIQVAPLVITPFLIKFSGSLLGRIAGMVNNPAKGLGDRAKNWSKGKADLAKDRRIANGARGTGLARRLAEGKRRDEALKKRYETMSQRNFNESALGRQLALDQKLADDRLARADKLNDAAYEELKRTDPKVRMESVQLKIADMTLNANKAKMDAYLHELESEKGAKYHAQRGDVAASSLGSSMHKLAEESMVQASRQSIAEDVHKAEFATHMVKNAALQAAAGGIAGAEGEVLATARATQTIRSDFGKGIEASAELMKHFNLSSGQVHSLALNKSVDSKGRPIMGEDSEGNKYEFSPNVAQMFEAAIEKDMKENNFSAVREIIELSGTDAYAGVRTTIKDGIVKNGIPAKAAFMGGKSIDMVGTGEITQGSYHRMIAQTIAKGKVDQQALVTNDSEALKDVYNLLQGRDHHGNTVNAVARMSREERQNYGEQLPVLYKTAYDTLTNPRLSDKLKPNAKAELKRIAELGGFDVSSL